MSEVLEHRVKSLEEERLIIKETIKVLNERSLETKYKIIAAITVALAVFAIGILSFVKMDNVDIKVDEAKAELLNAKSEVVAAKESVANVKKEILKLQKEIKITKGELKIASQKATEDLERAGAGELIRIKSNLDVSLQQFVPRRFVCNQKADKAGKIEYGTLRGSPKSFYNEKSIGCTFDNSVSGWIDLTLQGHIKSPYQNLGRKPKNQMGCSFGIYIGDEAINRSLEHYPSYTSSPFFVPANMRDVAYIPAGKHVIGVMFKGSECWIHHAKIVGMFYPDQLKLTGYLIILYK